MNLRRKLATWRQHTPGTSAEQAGSTTAAVPVVETADSDVVFDRSDITFSWAPIGRGTDDDANDAGQVASAASDLPAATEEPPAIAATPGEPEELLADADPSVTGDETEPARPAQATAPTQAPGTSARVKTRVTHELAAMARPDTMAPAWQCRCGDIFYDPEAAAQHSAEHAPTGPSAGSAATPTSGPSVALTGL